jgi:hypothetical protein
MTTHHRQRGVALPTAGLLVLAAISLAAQAGQAPSPATARPAAPAQTSKPDAALPTARAVIDRHIQAIGGRAAIMARTSTHATGTVSIPSAGMKGSVEVFAAKPDKSLLRITLGDIGAIEEAYNGTIGWSISPMTGPALSQGKELDQRRFDSDFLADLHLDTRFESMTTVEKTEFEGRPCYKVRLVKRAGGEEFEFYDVETGLKAGGISTRETPMGAITGTTVESDYKRFGPLLQATTIKSSAMGIQQLITLTMVEYDKVDPSIFEPPAAIKALVK